MSRGSRPKWTIQARTKFLELLAKAYSVRAAARAIGVSRSYLYRLREADPGFASAWQNAFDYGTDMLEDEVRRRAVEGVERVILYRGQPVGTVRKYSDGLLMFALRARRPEKYRERHEVRSDRLADLDKQILAARKRLRAYRESRGEGA